MIGAHRDFRVGATFAPPTRLLVKRRLNQRNHIDVAVEMFGFDERAVGLARAEARIPVLENQSLRLAHSGRLFWLIGLGDQLAKTGRRFGRHGVDDPPRALREVNDDAPAIPLVHESYVCLRAPDWIALTLCGRAHDGQINLPLIGAMFAHAQPGQERYVYGVYSEGARRAVVSGGLGASLAPVRNLRPPEVVIFDVMGNRGGLGGVAASRSRWPASQGRAARDIRSMQTV